MNTRDEIRLGIVTAALAAIISKFPAETVPNQGIDESDREHARGAVDYADALMEELGL